MSDEEEKPLTEAAEGPPCLHCAIHKTIVGHIHLHSVMLPNGDTGMLLEPVLRSILDVAGDLIASYPDEAWREQAVANSGAYLEQATARSAAAIAANGGGFELINISVGRPH